MVWELCCERFITKWLSNRIILSELKVQISKKVSIHEKSAKSFDNSFLSDVCETEIFYENDICAFDSTIKKWCERYAVKGLSEL